MEHLSIEQPELRNRIISLGRTFSSIFRGGNQGAREGENVQRALTLGGTAWERVVCWYLNALGCGLNAVALQGASQSTYLPDSFRNAFLVTINNHVVSSDLDVIQIHWIGEDGQDWMQTRYESTNRANMLRARRHFRELMDESPESFAVNIVSCKTNWNDAIQTPMLWNMVFSHGFHHGAISVGINHQNPQEFGHFSYSFATVPSNSSWVNYGSNRAEVIRGSTMSGGSYYGHSTNLDIGMRSLDELYSGRTQMPSGAVVGSGFSAFIQNPDGLAAFQLN
uniref:Uncharacterized protein n=1 Tax=uncultured marine group II/III euryarchaeote KM3_69_H04 TaxID=1456492 RepID=A0A075HL54_9EURY|nr:hypothetical protein [uncultured marine group II/III euryarchaeote KM3_69_H04]